MGIQHYDLFFPDGTIPSKELLSKFLHISENSNSAIAVHCKVGNSVSLFIKLDC